MFDAQDLDIFDAESQPIETEAELVADNLVIEIKIPATGSRSVQG
jgi:hypothetical protein